MMPPDYLLERTRHALAEAIALSKERSRIFPLVFYETGEGARSFPFAFEDFVAAIKVTDKADNYRRRAAAMGSPFFILAMTLRDVADFPKQIETARETWDETVLDIINGIRPQCVVFISRQIAGSLGIVGAAPETLAIVATGLHPAKIVGLAAALVSTSSRSLAFLPVVEIEGGIVRDLSAERFRRIYGPGRT